MIPFTQYLMPNGRRQQIEIRRPKRVEDLAARFIASGGWFEAEVLSTGDVSLTACRIIDGEPQDIAGRIVPNDERVPWAVDMLVEHVTGTPHREARAA